MRGFWAVRALVGMLPILIWAFGGGRAAALDLELHAPAGCPREAELAARVRSLVAQKGRVERELRARIDITHVSSGAFRLALRVVLGKQELSRVIEAAACQSVCDAAAWLIAMAAAEPEPHPSQAKRATAADAPATKVQGVNQPGRAAGPAGESRGDLAATRARGEEHAATASDDASAMAADATTAAGVTSAGAATPREDASTQPGSQPSVPQRSEERAREMPGPATSEASAMRDRPAPAPERPRAGLRPQWGRVSAAAGYFDAGLPHGGASFAILGGYGRGPFYVQLRGLFALPVAASLSGSGSVRMRTGQLSLAGCVVWGERWRGGPCLELRGARSVIEVAEVSKPGEQSVFWLSGGPSAQLGVRVWRQWEWVAEGGLGLPFTGRPRVRVEGRDDVIQASFVSGFVFLGTGARWR